MRGMWRGPHWVFQGVSLTLAAVLHDMKVRTLQNGKHHYTCILTLFSECFESLLADFTTARLASQQWRQREFKVGGDEASKWVACGEGNTYGKWMFPSPCTGGGVWEGAIFCFVISKWRILVNSDVLNLKFFLYREPPQWGLGRFCGKFWIFEQNNE